MQEKGMKQQNEYTVVGIQQASHETHKQLPQASTKGGQLKNPRYKIRGDLLGDRNITYANSLGRLVCRKVELLPRVWHRTLPSYK